MTFKESAFSGPEIVNRLVTLLVETTPFDTVSFQVLPRTSNASYLEKEVHGSRGQKRSSIRAREPEFFSTRILVNMLTYPCYPANLELMQVRMWHEKFALSFGLASVTPRSVCGLVAVGLESERARHAQSTQETEAELAGSAGAREEGAARDLGHGGPGAVGNNDSRCGKESAGLGIPI